MILYWSMFTLNAKNKLIIWFILYIYVKSHRFIYLLLVNC